MHTSGLLKVGVESMAKEQGNPNTCRRDTEHTANALLTAAAPDLLEACRYVVNWHREHDSGEGELFGLDFVTTCIAAIRKATEVER